MRKLARVTILAALLGSADGRHVAPTALPDTVQAIARFEQRATADPRDPLTPTTLAGLYLRAFDESGDRDALRHAAAAARLALARQPDHLPAQVMLSRALFADGAREAAQAIVSTVLAADPVDIGGLGVAFDLALATGADARAAMLADRLLSRDESPETIDRLGQLAQRRGDPVRAAALWQRAAADAADLGARDAEIAKYRTRVLAISRR